MTDQTTRRAEEIRETTGIPWEIACQRAELERDAQRLPSPFDTLRETTNAGNPASVDTMRAELELHRASRRSASERTLSRLRVIFHLSQLADDGIVTSLHRSGSRYMLSARGFRGERSYSLAELEAFVHGADAARGL